MNTTIQDQRFPTLETLTGENQIIYLLTKPLEENLIKQEFTIQKNASLKLTIIDFSSGSLDFSLSLHLLEGASVKVSLASILTGNENKKYDITTIHEEKDSVSLTKMAGINCSSGFLKFLGSSKIKNGAKRSDTRQEGKITNLTKEAKSECSPALIIDENDVKASHGAALGAYNPDHLYYLMSRGLSLEESQKLITYGTLIPILEEVKEEETLRMLKEVLGALTL